MPIIAYYFNICHIYFKPFLIYKITDKVEVCSKVGNFTLNPHRWTNKFQCPCFPNLSWCPWHWSMWRRLAGTGRRLKNGKEQGGKNSSRNEQIALSLGSDQQNLLLPGTSHPEKFMKIATGIKHHRSLGKMAHKPNEVIYKLTGLPTNQWTFLWRFHDLFANSQE